MCHCAVANHAEGFPEGWDGPNLQSDTGEVSPGGGDRLGGSSGSWLGGR